MFWYVVLAVIVVLVALAWWSSGRSKPRTPRDVAAEKDYNVYGSQRSTGQQGGML